jgi:hypothetical protein
VLVLMGLPCLLDPVVFLEKSRAAKWTTWSFSAFWFTRLYVQWFVYEVDLGAANARRRPCIGGSPLSGRHWHCSSPLVGSIRPDGLIEFGSARRSAVASTLRSHGT